MAALGRARLGMDWWRTRLALAAALVALSASAAPPATPVTADLITAAKAEGKVVFYTSIDLEVAAKIVKTFEASYPGITVQVERNGAERTFQRKKLALGERPIMADGLEYLVLLMKENGSPVEIVHPSEGTPFLSGSAAIADKAPHPNAARLLISFLFSRDAQQFMSDVGGLRSFHPDVRLKVGRTPIGDIKLMKSDPETQEKETETIKRKYVEYFGI
jgi:ABC-type glycerol-3-phosphate transport system substrate-binding protein